MFGYRKANLDLVNKLFSTDSSVMFKKVNHHQIDLLAVQLKNLKYYVESYFATDELLQMEMKQFITICRRVFGTIRNYNIFFRANDEAIVNFIQFTRRKAYLELFKAVVEPIVNTIRDLREAEANAYVTCIESLIESKEIDPKKTIIITRSKILDVELAFGDNSIRIMYHKDFVDEGLYTDTLIFIGSSSFFDKKFIEIFYANKNYFIAYSSFENNLISSSSFKKVVHEEQRINTIYRRVKIDTGIQGILFKEISSERVLNQSEDTIIARYEGKEKESSDLVEAKVATISNNNYIFLPLMQKINVIDRDTLKVSQASAKEIEQGDLLLFRTQNATTFIRDIADEILGEEALKHRKNIEVWKRKLRRIIEVNGIERVSKVLRRKHKIEVARVHNIKYWISNYAIKPTCLPELLNIMNFEEDQKKSILNSARLINSAHISAGHKISSSLMNELDRNLENIIEEKGYYTFESSEFKGASFNIEEIKKISKKSYYIPEKDTLKIIKN